MMIDYVTLMLVNMAAGFFLLGCFVWRGLDAEDRINWVPAFGICGLVAAVCGFVMTFTWPLPKPFSMAFGEDVGFAGGFVPWDRLGAGTGMGADAAGNIRFFRRYRGGAAGSQDY